MYRITERAVARAIENQTPIVVSICFGGNKLWRLDEAPEIDWAELFSLLYYLKWMKTIAAVHAPGARLDFFSQDLSVESLDNLTRGELDRYSQTFTQLIDWLEPYMPKGVQITYRRHRDMFADEAAYYAELERAKQEILAKNDGKLPELTDEMKTRTELNVRLRPGQDSDPQWREKVELQHQAIFITPTLNTYFTDPDMIFACPTYYGDSIVTGSTKRSLAKLWAGVGALQKDNETFHELVLTPKQLAGAAFDWEKASLPGLIGKNFSKVRILR